MSALSAMKEAKIWLLTEVLTRMDKLLCSPDREKFCINFDKEYERKRKQYRELMGKEWSGEHGD